MDDYQAPPPEGELITAALKRIRPRLSIREAARRAGISEGWWRQVVRGYQPIKGGGKAPMTGSAETIAAMARVVGVTPEQLEQAGRTDAAEELRILEEPPSRLQVVTGADAPADEPGDEGLDEKLDRAQRLLAEGMALLEELRRERRESG